MPDVVPAWTPVCEDSGLWGIETWSAKGWHWRASAVALADGGTAVVGPLRNLGEHAHESLQALGAPRFLLAPNHFHYLGLAEYEETYPGVQVVASEVAVPRIQKRAGLSAQLCSTDELAAQLPDHIELLTPPGLKTGEVWLRVETRRGVAWIVSDAFFNLEENARGAMGVVLRLTGTAPGLRIGRTFTGLAVRGKSYRQWLLAELERDPPRLLIPGHGAVLEADDLAARLIELAQRRL